MTAQLFPTAALAADSSESALNKAPGYQDFPAYYSDSAHADDQVTHPDVVVLEEPWNGYRYWAVYTPNVMRISIYENPSIVASSDGVHWVEPEGLSNPIEPQPPSTRYHNCDADMVYNAEYDAMMAYWNWADDQGGGVGAEVRLRISYDGVHWGVPVTYDEMTRVWSKPPPTRSVRLRMERMTSLPPLLLQTATICSLPLLSTMTSGMCSSCGPTIPRRGVSEWSGELRGNALFGRRDHLG